jgi:hypothetical protein
MKKIKSIFGFCLFVLAQGHLTFASDPSIESLKIESKQIFSAQGSVFQKSDIQRIFKDVMVPSAVAMMETVYDLWEKNPALNYYAQASIKPSQGLRYVWINAHLLNNTKQADAHESLVYQFLAAPALPYKEQPYTFDELVTIFRPIKESSFSLFKDGMKILLDPKSGTPKHTGQHLIDAYRCLLGKCIYAHHHQDTDTLQTAAIEQLFAFPQHKKILLNTQPDLAKQITGSPCAQCAKQVEKSRMLPYPFELKDDH